MQTILTAKLKLQTTPDQFRALRQTQLAYRDALNFVSRYAFAHGKTSNQIHLQEGTYHEIRTRFGLSAQMACNVPRQVGATYKGLWTKVRQNLEALKAGATKKRYKGLEQPPKYVSPTLTYNLGRDYSFKSGQQVSILSLEGRLVLSYRGYARHMLLIQQATAHGPMNHPQQGIPQDGGQRETLFGAKLGAAKLWYDKPRKQFYLLVSLEVEVADPTPQMHQRVVGVDVGQRYLAVATDTQNKTAFFSGKAARATADHYARLRKRLQQKGTRAATQRLVVIAGRERRLKQDRNHMISRCVVDTYSQSLIGLEDLTHIRERTQRKRHKGGKGRKPSNGGTTDSKGQLRPLRPQTSAKQRRANRQAAQWAFAELHRYVAYKALLAGSLAVKVDAHYTSQCCPRCGYTAKGNRPEQGLLFVCQACHLALHADLVGARNIALRTLLARHDWVRTGVLSERPDVSDSEAKAMRRQRYTELRWSPDTSPLL